MRILTVFYSLEGNCRALAEIIRETAGGEFEALRPETEIPRQGFRRFLTGGKMVFQGNPCPNQPLTASVADYDLVFVGTPVWWWHMSPPVLRFLSDTDWSGRPVALYVLSGGGPGWTLRAMRKLVEARGGQVVSSAGFIDLRRRKPAATRERAAVWAREAVKSADPKIIGA